MYMGENDGTHRPHYGVGGHWREFTTPQSQRSAASHPMRRASLTPTPTLILALALTPNQGKPAVQRGEFPGCARGSGGAGGVGGGAGGGVPYVLLAQRAPRLDVGRGLVRVRLGLGLGLVLGLGM